MSNLTNHNPKIQIVCGPTGSGKTAFAFKLAGDKPTSIISADSRQIYQGLDIITGKDIPIGFEKKISSLTFNNRPIVYYTLPVIPSEVEGSIRLWGFDLLSPDEVYNAADFSMLSRRIIAEESKQGRLVFIVGGTGFYLKSLTQPESLAGVSPDEKLRHELEKLTIKELQHRLERINSKRLASMNQSDVNNPRRLIRAIEIASYSPPLVIPASLSSSRTRGSIYIDSHFRGNDNTIGSGMTTFSWIGLRVPLEIIRERIESRVLTRLDRGAIVEAENLLRSYPDQNLPVYTTLGVKPIIKFINKEIDLHTLVNTWVTDEVNYAKRQITWFKKQPEIVWYDE